MTNGLITLLLESILIIYSEELKTLKNILKVYKGGWVDY